MILVNYFCQVKNMAPKWYEYAQKSTSPNEHIIKNYAGNLDGNYGHLMISDKKLFFVKEEGFFRKKYSVPFILPYNKVKDIHPLDKYHLQISEKTGKTHEFECELSASSVNKAIHEEMN